MLAMYNNMKMPQSSNSNSNDEKASLYLAKFFPIRWHKYRPVGTFNAREVGQDYVYEIITKENVHTGAEFCVQNKVIEKGKGKNRGNNKSVKAPIEVSTLNYLVSISAGKPVILHFFDENVKKGYWIWLHDFIQEYPQSEWQEHGEIIVTIPRDKVMSRKAVKEIEEFVLREHHFNLLQTKAINASRTNPNYAFIPSRGADWVSIATYAKHEKALENEPISYTMTLGEEANRKLIYAVETGEEVQFSAKSFRSEGAHDDIVEAELSEEIEITAKPLVPNEAQIRKFQYLDDNDHELFSTGFIQMKLDRQGTLVEKWIGQLHDLPVSLVYTEDKRTNQTCIDAKVNTRIRDAVILNRYHNTILLCRSAKKVREINAKEEEVSLIMNDAPNEPFTEQQMWWHGFVAALATIALKTGINIPIPDKCSSSDVVAAEEIAQILREGIHKHRPPASTSNVEDVVVIPFPFKLIKEIVENENLGVGTSFLVPMGSAFMVLFDHQIEMGEAIAEFWNTRVSDNKELYRVLDDGGPDDRIVELAFKVDPEQIYTKFPKWWKES